MASEIGVLVVHGIAVQQENFADAFIAEMTSRLERLSVDRGVVEWRSGFWADLLTPHEVKLWDEQANHGLGTNPFERTETVAGMVTFGSNIPLFSLALPEVRCIEFPPASLAENLKANAKWLNFFDADDVLGYPLKPLSPSYEATVDEDIEINAGGLFTSWNRYLTPSIGPITISPNRSLNLFATSFSQTGNRQHR